MTDSDDVVATISILLFQLGSALVFGFFVYRAGIVKERDSIAFLAGKIMLPALAFNTVVVAQMDSLHYLVIASCVWGKFVIFVFVIIMSFVFMRSRPLHERLISGGIFSFHVTASNDFVIGIPIAKVFYPGSGMSQLTALVLVQYAFFQSISLAMVEVGLCQRRGALLNVNSRSPYLRAACTVAKNILWNPLILAVVFGVIYSELASFVVPGVAPHKKIPEPLSSLLNFITAPYAMLALFLTGANLTDAFRQLGGQRSLTNSAYNVGVPVSLCLLKNLVCPFVAVSFIQIVWANVGVNPRWSLFCFLYGSIPTSNAPLFIALQANMHREVVAAAIFLGLIVSVPMLILFASLFGQGTRQVILQDLVAVQEYTGVASVVCSMVVLGFFVSYAYRSEQWQRLPHTMLPGYGLSVLLYGCSLLSHTWSDCNSAYKSTLVVIFTFFQMQCRVWVALMLLFVMRPASSLWKNWGVAAAVILLSLLLSSIVPPSTLNEVCGLSFTQGQLLRVSVFVTLSCTVLSVVGLMGIHRQPLLMCWFFSCFVLCVFFRRVSLGPPGRAFHQKHGKHCASPWIQSPTDKVMCCLSNVAPLSLEIAPFRRSQFVRLVVWRADRDEGVALPLHFRCSFDNWLRRRCGRIKSGDSKAMEPLDAAAEKCRLQAKRV